MSGRNPTVPQAVVSLMPSKDTLGNQTPTGALLNIVGIDNMQRSTLARFLSLALWATSASAVTPSCSERRGQSLTRLSFPQTGLGRPWHYRDAPDLRQQRWPTKGSGGWRYLKEAACLALLRSPLAMVRDKSRSFPGACGAQRRAGQGY